MFQPHSETSKAAYETIDEQGQLEEVMAVFDLKGSAGATCDEIHKYLQKNHPLWEKRPLGTVSARMIRLKRDGRIFYKNEKRLTEAKRPAEVWVSDKYATESERLWTAQKPAPNAEIVIEHIESAERFLNALVTGKIVSGVHLSAAKHNINELQKAKKILE
jgi:hypothetical protein